MELEEAVLLEIEDKIMTVYSNNMDKTRVILVQLPDLNAIKPNNKRNANTEIKALQVLYFLALCESLLEEAVADMELRTMDTNKIAIVKHKITMDQFMITYHK